MVGCTQNILPCPAYSALALKMNAIVRNCGKPGASTFPHYNEGSDTCSCLIKKSVIVKHFGRQVF